MIIYTMKVIFLKCPILMFFSLLECIKGKSRLYCNHKKSNIKPKICTKKHINTSLNDLFIAFKNHGRHGLL